jgi:hypothetical protein
MVEEIEQDEKKTEPFSKWGTINSQIPKILNTQKFGDIYSVTFKE